MENTIHTRPIFNSSPIQQVDWAGKSYWIKRDDLLHPLLNGNKARKLFYYLQHEFPNKTTFVSCGGNQSNAMLALAALAQLKNWQFHYYIKPLPNFLYQQPSGNFQQALALGMHYTEITDFSAIKLTATDLWIPQGGASPEATDGLKQLATELTTFIHTENKQDVGIFVPSGTGATAFYLQQHMNYPVFTTACIGTSDYLHHCFQQLSCTTTKHYPIILEQSEKYPFGKPHPTLLNTWQTICTATQIEFDLLYDPLGWLALQQHADNLPNTIIYIHCGGISGNNTMLARYKRQKLC
ncbi:pyridoxal-phosphate dependent enzyme [Beggiatoa leptomitoformis]|uniref:Pyridoxal-phosphate dependent enzyme n=1 Tax=Beggiatoa leptomitoformis TaxID=288004 RepID=A0A2N9YEU2_9GAMM|nr:pyridoxal-phosphate dependent enzyme [Beggiatoa leptomitoformis]AUI69001.1 pyridoxal-phosphate dependent enzyme [Beggiatoa leptomitoformis]